MSENKSHVDFVDDGDITSETEINTDLAARRMSSIRRRIDWRLLPALSLIYGISLMDKKNTANAAIAGMLVDLHLTRGYGYNIITLSFFIASAVVQPIMTIFCRKIGPRYFLSGLCFAWGVVLIGFGFVHDWRVMIPLRVILGLLEAGFFPGAFYLLSTWYTRFEIAIRFSIFHLTGCLLASLSGILAYGLMQLEGKGGLRGWRWIFILEGVITCVVGIFSLLVLVKFPDEEVRKPSTRFLTIDECKSVINKLDADRGDIEVEPFTMSAFLKPAMSLDVWGFAFNFFLATTVSFAFAFFLPVILTQKLGFSVAVAQCLGSPPYAVAALVMYAGSWAGDRYRKRGLIIQVNSLISIIGLPIMAFHPNPAVQYFGVFVAIAGVNANIPALMAFQHNNIRGQWERAFCSAMLTTFGAIGGISGSLIFRTQDAPRYLPGMVACIVCTVLTSIVTAMMSWRFHHLNKQADRGEMIIHGLSEFRYTL